MEGRRFTLLGPWVSDDRQAEDADAEEKDRSCKYTHFGHVQVDILSAGAGLH